VGFDVIRLRFQSRSLKPFGFIPLLEFGEHVSQSMINSLENKKIRYEFSNFFQPKNFKTAF
jgi:hypothetical protein